MARTDNLKVFLTDVADAIRTKKGTTELIPANTFDTEIESISGGKEEQSKSVTITQNGTQTITPDENKTLSSVEITTNVLQKPEQAKSVTITQNGSSTVTPDEGKVLSSVEITTNVGDERVLPLGEKDINFYGASGELVESWSLTELEGKTALPNPLQYDGLTFDGWNWSLEDLKENNDWADVGAIYKTTDNSLRIYISLQGKDLSPVLGVGQNILDGFNIDWGDGSELESSGSSFNSSSYTPVNKQHIYQKSGNYIITLHPNEGCTITLGGTSAIGSQILWANSSTANDSKPYQCSIIKIECGNNVISSSYSFAKLIALRQLIYPLQEGRAVTYGIGSYAFQKCEALSYLALPKDELSSSSAGAIGTFGFDGSGLSLLSIPKEFTASAYACFRNCSRLNRVRCRLSGIGESTFYGCSSLVKPSIYRAALVKDMFLACTSLRYIEFPLNITDYYGNNFPSSYLQYVNLKNNTQIPTRSTTPTGVYKIVVPDTLYDEWIADSSWAAYADRIIKLSDYNAL